MIGSKVLHRLAQAQRRHRIHGVLTREREQFVFVDTPGFQTRHGGAMEPHDEPGRHPALADVDVVVHVVEAGRSGPTATPKLLPLLPDPARTILVVSKIDELKKRDELSFPSSPRSWHTSLRRAWCRCSALQGAAARPTAGRRSRARLPEGEPLFEEDALTDRSMRFIAAELVREKIFRLVGDELPYGCTVRHRAVGRDRRERAHRRLRGGRARQPPPHPAGRGRLAHEAHRHRGPPGHRQAARQVGAPGGLHQGAQGLVRPRARCGTWATSRAGRPSRAIHEQARPARPGHPRLHAPRHRVAQRLRSSCRPSRASTAAWPWSPRAPSDSYSVLRPVLTAFQPLALSWSGCGEVKTLTRAETAGVRAAGGRPRRCRPGT